MKNLIDVIEISSCCSKRSYQLKINGFSISKDLLDYLVKTFSYTEALHFTKSGLLYLENNQAILTAAFGNNVLKINCKIKEQSPQIIENLKSSLVNFYDPKR